ncbi:MAG TPA: phosphoribosyl-ATP diphosphatase [Planctomycetaceae bacterium]|nr:phosphoribosyl-ATP diphosphatase [Planctomycetaceae bacterium]
MTASGGSILSRLEQVIANRATAPRDDSYVAQLLNDAPDSVCQKLIEEAYEVVHALNGDEEESIVQADLIHEAADLVFHLLVALGYRGVSWRSVENELERRFGMSGIEEKRSRRPGDE